MGLKKKKITKRKKKTVARQEKPAELQSKAQDDLALKNYNDILEKVNRGLRAYIAEMTSVFQFIERVSAVHAFEKIIELLVEVLNELCQFDATAIYLHDNLRGQGSRKQLVYQHDMETINKFRQAMEVDERIYQWVFRQGQAVIIPESFRKQNSTVFDNWSFMIAPLATNSEQIGHIELAFNRPQGSFTQQMFSILNVLLKHVAVILVNERVYEKERQTAQKYIELDLLKKDVVNTTTHEIKTPLTIIQGASILLEGDNQMDVKEQKELLRKIIAQCKRVDLIISELFETAQVDDQEPLIKPVKINLLKITQDTLADVLFDARRINFTINIPENIELEIDQSSFYKVIRNLIENAIKYSHQGGEIVITGQADQHHIEWQIRDQGIGISQIDQEKIFDKFFRGGESSTRRVGGIGLGLYIVQKNIELNHGSIRVESTKGKGATFIVTIPKNLMSLQSMT